MAPRPRTRTLGSGGGGAGPTMSSRGSESDAGDFALRRGLSFAVSFFLRLIFSCCLSLDSLRDLSWDEDGDLRLRYLRRRPSSSEGLSSRVSRRDVLRLSLLPPDRLLYLCMCLRSVLYLPSSSDALLSRCLRLRCECLDRRCSPSSSLSYVRRLRFSFLRSSSRSVEVRLERCDRCELRSSRRRLCPPSDCVSLSSSRRRLEGREPVCLLLCSTSRDLYDDSPLLWPASRRALSRALDSSASFASSAALWVSVSRKMFRKKRVFGLGAWPVGLHRCQFI